jgi:YD repeat-containing protein
LTLTRYYNSDHAVLVARLGANWRHTYDRSVNNGIVFRPDGKAFEFDPSTLTSQPNITHKLEKLSSGWRFTNSDDDSVEIFDANGTLLSITSRSGLVQTLNYDATGRLASVVDTFGRSLTFGYDDATSQLTTVTDPAGNLIAYGYDSASNLKTVTYSGGAIRTYVYDNPTFPNAITGIIDENNNRHATYAYDPQGRAVSSEHAGGAGRVVLTFNADGSTTEADALNTQRIYGFQTVFRLIENTGVSQPCSNGCGASASASTYDPNTGFLSSSTDWNGNLTKFTKDVRGLEISRTEGLAATGATTPQTRTISTQWHPVFRLPVLVAEPLRITSYVYNGDGGASCGVAPGVLCSKTIQPTSDATGAAGFGATSAGAARTWRYTYNANGSVLSMDGPRTDVADVTTYAYYANNDPDLGKRGNVASIANALGQITQILSYNAHGQPLTVVDPNGLTTSLTYDARLRLTSRNVGGEMTTYGYDGVGQLLRVTLPDSSFLTYGYDAAHRLTGIADSAGNSIAYTLDAMGNRIGEQVFDPAGGLAQTRSRVYDALNRLAQDLGAQSQTTTYAYDAQGNVTGVTDPLGHATSNAYDALNRLVQVTDPGNGVTRYTYNGIDHLVAVSDPRNLTTSYSYDGLSNLNAQASPDAGLTQSTYDAAGNLLTQTDAKGQTTRYAYDPLNRVTSIAFADGSTQNYGYDQGTNGLGRLTFFAETNSANQITVVQDYAYDAHGRTTVENRNIGGVNYAFGYGYDTGGRLSAMSYPSGRTIAYGFDAAGRISQVNTTAPPSAGGATQVAASNISYQPFGGVKSYALGNGQLYARAYDQDGRIVAYGAGSQGASLGYDPAGRIVSIADATSSNSYGYDALDRLTSAATPAASFAYTYDPVGNRTSKAVGTATDAYTYSATSNRIASISGGTTRSFSFDPNGSTIADGLNQYTYDARGRMVNATSPTGTAFYQVNALGQRVRKTTATDDRVFLYDLRGHLIEEASPGGTPLREYLYLNDIPLMVFQ